MMIVHDVVRRRGNLIMRNRPNSTFYWKVQSLIVRVVSCGSADMTGGYAAGGLVDLWLARWLCGHWWRTWIRYEFSPVGRSPCAADTMNEPICSSLCAASALARRSPDVYCRSMDDVSFHTGLHELDTEYRNCRRPVALRHGFVRTSIQSNCCFWNTFYCAGRTQLEHEIRSNRLRTCDICFTKCHIPRTLILHV